MILGIYCAGSLGKELYDIVERINVENNRWEKVVFIDEIRIERTYYGLEVWKFKDVLSLTDRIEFIIANGTPIHRKTIWANLKKENLKMTNLIDPTAIISPTAKLGEGVIITPFSTVSSDVIIGDNSLIQSYVRVGHDICIGRNSVVSSNVGIGGKTVVGDETYIAMGAVVQDELKIGHNVIIGMGAVVHTDIPDNVTVVGLPARISKKNETGILFKQE